MLDAASAEERDITSSEKDLWDVLISEIDGIDAAAKRTVRPRPEWARNIHSPGERRMETRDKIWMPYMREYRALSEGTATAGGHLVPPEHSRTWLDYLRERSVFLAAGPNILPARSDSLHVPKLTGSVSVNMVAENAQIPASHPHLWGASARAESGCCVYLGLASGIRRQPARAPAGVGR